MANSRILTVSELADHLNVHRITIYRLLKSGNLPGFKIGRVWRFDLDDITAWMASGKTSEALYNHDGYLPSHLDGKAPPSTAGDGKPPMTPADKSSTHHDGSASNDVARQLRQPQARNQPPSASRSNDIASLRGGSGGKSVR